MTRSDDGDTATLARAQQWREAFDEAFVRAPVEDSSDMHDYLAIRAGSGSYALRLDEVGGLQTLGGLTPCPTRRAELLGLCSFRATVMPVYDLRVLLGSGGGGEAPAWWVAVNGAPLGLAFDVFERHVRLPDSAIAKARGADARLYTGETLRCEGQLRPIVSIQSILLNIREAVQQAAQAAGA
ncbi:chemotaxis protein CheW [Pelomonas sp. KK5]|uniref:chemotaxis protein CheW n=1 Tax=Pelomonas sp. KK5 TaxID=1855730 RepID=UPI00097C51C5|nr:chemotaxis protein CheW [Pelomonas sp. KK5]